jgi:hypothetical protein
MLDETFYVFGSIWVHEYFYLKNLKLCLDSISIRYIMQ